MEKVGLIGDEGSKGPEFGSLAIPSNMPPLDNQKALLSSETAARTMKFGRYCLLDEAGLHV